MPELRPYKETLFDRLGPDAGNYIKAMAYGGIAGGVSIVLLGVIGSGLLGLRPLQLVGFVLAGASAIAAGSSLVGIWLMNEAEAGVHKIMTGGNSTPYTQQHSYQQALVMQGRLDEALASLEAHIAEPNSTLDVRIRAAELYTREAARHERAAELFREVARHPASTAGEEVYSVNRLVDLLSGPLDQPGRALVELRRLADRYPTSVVGERARAAIRELKALKAQRDEMSAP